jgi:hypothetical protein
MKNYFSDVTLPTSEAEIRELVSAAFLNLTGKPIISAKEIYLDRLAHGGMSSGCISPDFWRHRAMEALLNASHIDKTKDNLDWFSIFDQACAGHNDILAWGLPEPWVQTQIFGTLIGTEPNTCWQPLKNEVPYATRLPVYQPKHRDIASQGAIKWIDLCLVSDRREEWCWFELKVRHTGKGEQRVRANKSAQSSIKKDIAALVGMDVGLTASAWVNPDQYTTSHWFDEVLGPHKHKLPKYRHSFVMAYLQLFGALDENLLCQEAIESQTRDWIASRNKKQGTTVQPPDFDIQLYSQQIAGEHSLVVIRWTQ